MKTAFYDTKKFEREIFDALKVGTGVEFLFLEGRLTAKTAALAHGCEAVCAFVNDKLDGECLRALKHGGVKLVALRSAGFNHVDLKAAEELRLQVARVPGYSPHAVAEYSLALLLTLNRKIHKSYARTRELNFSLDGLVGFDLFGKTVGVIGTGRIGSIFAKAVAALGCKVIAHDLYPSTELIKETGIHYGSLEEVFLRSDVISLHVPLVPETKHLIEHRSIALMKKGVTIINTGRGGLINTRALIEGLKAKHIGAVALDVYEEEEEFFFQDLSETGLSDDVLARLLTFPNVLVTSHQAFLTREALENIARTTLDNLREFGRTGEVISNRIGR